MLASRKDGSWRLVAPGPAFVFLVSCPASAALHGVKHQRTVYFHAILRLQQGIGAALTAMDACPEGIPVQFGKGLKEAACCQRLLDRASAGQCDRTLP